MMLQDICFKNLSQNYFPYYKIGYGEVDPYHIYLYIHYYNYIKRSLFLLIPNEISLLPLIPSFSFKTVLIDFLTIIKYRKNDINKIVRLVENSYKRYSHSLDPIRQQQKQK